MEAYFNIAGINNEVKNILLDLYIEDMSRVQVSIKYNYSIETITRKKDKALKKINNAISEKKIILPKCYKDLFK